MINDLNIHRMGPLIAVVLPRSKRIRIMTDCGSMTDRGPTLDMIASYEMEDTSEETIIKLLRDFLNTQIKLAPTYTISDRRGGFIRPSAS